MLLDIQNRGQLAAGITTYKPHSQDLLLTHRNVGLVSEVFKMSRKEKYNKLMGEHRGPLPSVMSAMRPAAKMILATLNV